MYPLPDLPCVLPTFPIPEFVDLEAVSSHFEGAFEVLGENHFLQDAIWRDNFAMTGTFRTFYSAKSIAAAWRNTSITHKPTAFAFHGKPQLTRTPGAAWVELMFTYETRGIPAITADGILWVAPDIDGVWKIWIMRTIIGQLKGQPNVDKLDVIQPRNDEKLVNGTNITHDKGPITNGKLTNGENHYSPEVDFQCVVIGGGQAGLGVGGRLKALGVSYVIMDKYEEVGDSWAKRYDSTRREWLPI